MPEEPTPDRRSAARVIKVVAAQEQLPGCVRTFGNSNRLMAVYHPLDPTLPYWHNFKPPDQFQQ